MLHAAQVSPLIYSKKLANFGPQGYANADGKIGYFGGLIYATSRACNQYGRHLALRLWDAYIRQSLTRPKLRRAFMQDYPAAMYGAELYSAYPDAKYILTTRDPAKWEKSMKATVQYWQQRCTEVSEQSQKLTVYANWGETYMNKKYHRGRLWTNTQEELIAHNDRVKRLIPSEKLLVFEVGEGWERLVEFLGVPIPTVPFPNINNTDQFLERVPIRIKGLATV